MPLEYFVSIPGQADREFKQFLSQNGGEILGQRINVSSLARRAKSVLSGIDKPWEPEDLRLLAGNYPQWANFQESLTRHEKALLTRSLKEIVRLRRGEEPRTWLQTWKFIQIAFPEEVAGSRR